MGLGTRRRAAARRGLHQLSRRRHDGVRHHRALHVRTAAPAPERPRLLAGPGAFHLCLRLDHVGDGARQGALDLGGEFSVSGGLHPGRAAPDPGHRRSRRADARPASARHALHLLPQLPARMGLSRLHRQWRGGAPAARSRAVRRLHDDRRRAVRPEAQLLGDPAHRRRRSRRAPDRQDGGARPVHLGRSLRCGSVRARPFGLLADQAAAGHRLCRGLRGDRLCRCDQLHEERARASGRLRVAGTSSG